VACINHYLCRSFKHWMGRPMRGSVLDDVLHLYPENHWRSGHDECLRRFVEHIAKETNEIVDESMERFKEPIEAYLKNLGVASRKLS
jgi:acyl carrier protein phosphodiesterase